MRSNCEAILWASRSGLSRPSQHLRCKPCKGVTGQPRAQALGAGVKPEPNPVGVEQKPVPPLQHQAHLRRSQPEGNLTEVLLLTQSTILLITLCFRAISQFKFLRRALLQSLIHRLGAHAPGCAARPFQGRRKRIAREAWVWRQYCLTGLHPPLLQDAPPGFSHTPASAILRRGVYRLWFSTRFGS